MFAAGQVVPTNAAEAGALRDDMNAQAADLTDLNGEAADARGSVEDTSNALNDARQATADAKQEADYSKNLARNAQQELDQALESMEQYQRQIENELKSLNPDKDRVASLYEQARFQHEMFLDEVRQKLAEGKQELFSEQQNRDAEIWRCICALISDMGRAMITDLVGRSSASKTLNFPSYFSPKQEPTDQSKYTYNSAQAAEREVAAKEANIRDRSASNPYAQMVADKKSKLAENQGKEKSANATYASAESAEAKAKSAWEGAREVYNSANTTAELAQNKLNDMTRGLQTYADKINEEDMKQRQEAAERQQQQA